MAEAAKLIDSDVFIDVLRTGSPSSRAAIEDHAAYSVITRTELFSGVSDAEHDLRRLLAPHAELTVSREIAELAGVLRRSVRIAVPDALIAATALLHDLTLVTRNVRHLERVPRLRLLSPTP
ncbi:MAG: nucleotide-binding protein [Thermoleophilia bacterium]|nr:nucleotide-binding protein [Thermoleophilia bacterium]